MQESVRMKKPITTEENVNLLDNRGDEVLSCQFMQKSVRMEKLFLISSDDDENVENASKDMHQEDSSEKQILEDELPEKEARIVEKESTPTDEDDSSDLAYGIAVYSFAAALLSYQVYYIMQNYPKY